MIDEEVLKGLVEKHCRPLRDPGDLEALAEDYLQVSGSGDPRRAAEEIFSEAKEMLGVPSMEFIEAMVGTLQGSGDPDEECKLVIGSLLFNFGKKYLEKYYRNLREKTAPYLEIRMSVHGPGSPGSVEELESVGRFYAKVSEAVSRTVSVMESVPWISGDDFIREMSKSLFGYWRETLEEGGPDALLELEGCTDPERYTKPLEKASKHLHRFARGYLFEHPGELDSLSGEARRIFSKSYDSLSWREKSFYEVPIAVYARKILDEAAPGKGKFSICFF